MIISNSYTNAKKVIQNFSAIIVAKCRLLVKKRKIGNKKKVANKCKKKVKTLILEPKTPNNFRNKYSKWDKVRKQ